MIRTDEDILAALDILSGLDDRLPAIIATAGAVPLRAGRPGLPGLAYIVTGQQVSRASANAIFARLDATVDLADPQAIRTVDDSVLVAAGLSGAKRRTMRAIAEAVIDRRLDFARIERAGAAESLAELVAIPGIGPWTGECYLLFCSGHPDVFPAGDLALQIAVQRAFALEARPKAKALEAMAALWSPHRSVAARLFWGYYAATGSPDAAPLP